MSSVVVPAGIAGIQAPWMDRSLPSMALDTRFPAGMTRFFGFLKQLANQKIFFNLPTKLNA
ncbi:MAG: hypothetical protein ACXWTT_02990 [Methylobacter sp.]